MWNIPALGRPDRQRTKHLEQVAESTNGNDDCYVGEGRAGYEQTDCPKPQPSVHCVGSPAAGFILLERSLLADDVPRSEPPTRPTAANPKATKPVTFSDQCKKKNGTMAPAAPISMAI